MRNRLIDWWRRRRLGAPRIDEVEVYHSQSDLPESLSRHQLALVGSPQRPKWLAFECPCGEGHRLQVNLSATKISKLAPRPRQDRPERVSLG